jgi:hypothetical protein
MTTVRFASHLIRTGLTAAFVFCAAAFSHGATIHTGDTIQGVPVISQLDTNDLEAGKKHRFMFQGVQMGTGQHWYVPVMVAKGANPGKKILIASGVHGDEVSPVDVVQRTFAALDPTRMSGTVVAVLDIARPAKEYVQRKWPVTESGGTLVDMNRVWPGTENGNNPAARQAWLVWNRLLKGNIEVALDFHTAATGADFSLFIFADFRKPEVQRIAELFPMQQIKDDPGEPGTMETSLVEAGISAVTVEVGAPRVFDPVKIRASVEGAMNVLAYYKVTDGKIGRTSKEANTFFGNKMETIRASGGGFVELLVKLTDKVKAGQKIAVQRNSFGDVVQEYFTTLDGEVAVIATDAMREPGSRIMDILAKSDDPECAKKGGCPYKGEDY